MAGTVSPTGEIDRRIGFKPPCPRCSKQGVHVNAVDPFGEKAFYCTECRNAWSYSEMKRSVEEWAKLLEWLSCLLLPIPEELRQRG